MADIEKGKKRRRRTATVHFYENMNKPARGRSESLAELRHDETEECATPDAVKGTAGNPVSQPGGRSLTEARMSPPLTAGHAAPSSGDHGAQVPADPMNQPGPKALALGHPSMRMGTTNPVPLLSMRTDSTDFPRDLTGMSNGVPVALSRLDAYSAAGAPDFRAQPSGSPVRPMDHIARDSATSRNGSHSLADPRSHAAPQAVKSSDAREIMRRHMFPGSGGAR